MFCQLVGIPEGLTFAKNGDLLMAACVNSGIGMAVRKPAVGKTVIMRSSDRGKTWREQGVLEHRADAGYDPRTAPWKACI